MQRKLGALYGALIGDAVGVPYEFYRASELPEKDLIDMVPPAGWKRAWPVLNGTWSDDGALTLCLLSALQKDKTHPKFVHAFSQLALAWLEDGYMTPDDRYFDIGGQTARALQAIQCGSNPATRVDNPSIAQGNGALMRGIAPALVADSIEEAEFLGRSHVTATHSTDLNAEICGKYARIAYRLLQSESLSDVLSAELKGWTRQRATGGAFVLDSFWSAIHALEVTDDFEGTIKEAIALGNDTDTTACIAGGLAGALYGYEGIPTRWIQGLRGKHLLAPLTEGL